MGVHTHLWFLFACMFYLKMYFVKLPTHPVPLKTKRQMQWVQGSMSLDLLVLLLQVLLICTEYTNTLIYSMQWPKSHCELIYTQCWCDQTCLCISIVSFVRRQFFSSSNICGLLKSPSRLMSPTVCVYVIPSKFSQLKQSQNCVTPGAPEGRKKKSMI